MSNNMKSINSRRAFINNMVLGSIALQIPFEALALFDKNARTTKIGLITDLHQDLIHNGQERLEAFLAHVKKSKPDAIMQMGDFAYPGDKNKAVIDLFNNAHQQRMHVIGNHDTDSGYTKQQCLDYWGMPARYYSKDINGVRFIILDGNDKGSPTHKGGYAAFINDEQFIWLEQQLKESSLPVVVVSHQPLAGALQVDNAEKIQALLAQYANKILIAINGHTHIDCLLAIKGVNYLHINSASYFWVGGKFKHDSYSAEIHKQYAWISSTCPYKDSLFTTMSIHPAKGVIIIEGRKSEWVGASPEALHYIDKDTIAPGKEIVPWIRSREIRNK